MLSISGTLRMTRSSSGNQLRYPSPLAASARTGIGTSAPLKSIEELGGIVPDERQARLRGQSRFEPLWVGVKNVPERDGTIL